MTQIRKICILAMMCAIAIASRLALAAFPNFKPIIGIVVVTAVAFGGVSGAAVGAVTMYLSNIVFGQGVFTPFQMLAMVLVGLSAGLFFRIKPIRKRLANKRPAVILLTFYGFFSALLIYGPIMNYQSMLVMSSKHSFQKFLLFEISGLPFDIPHAVASAIFLAIAGVPILHLIEKMTKTPLVKS